MRPLFVEALGAVTPVGLTAPGSCAAIRAGISRIAEAIAALPPKDPILGARVQAGRALRTTERGWLLNLASKALGECAAGVASTGKSVPLFLCVPEAFRVHPAFDAMTFKEMLEDLAKQSRVPIDLNASRVLFLGAAGISTALTMAQARLDAGASSCCIVGGVDSLFNDRDIARLQKDGRLHGSGNPQGVIPGEGAAFMAISTSGRESGYVPLAALTGFATESEPHPVASPKYSHGEGLGRAVRAALNVASLREPEVGFVVSNHNGERYAAWETTFAHARTYRTHRLRLPLMYPAISVGDTGAAASTLGIAVAAMALARDYAPGSVAVCESRSESDQRSACILRRVSKPPYLSPHERAPL